MIEHPDTNELKEVVLFFRNKIEPAWTEESAYKIPEITKYGPFISGGQCAVTCLVLKDVLKEKYPELHIYLAGGQLKKDGSIIISAHNWLKIGEGSNAIIIDPTVDQANGVSDKIIVDTVISLQTQGFDYIENELEADHGEELHPNRFRRYQLLKKNFEQLGKSNG